MHRCLRSIHDDMIRNITGMKSFWSDPKDWTSLAQEFKDAVSFWFETTSLATSNRYGRDLFDGWFAGGAIQTDPAELADSQPRLKAFLKVEKLSFSDAFHVRKSIRASAEFAQRHDDADEALLAIGAFLRLEEGQTVAEIDRNLIDRKCGPDDWEDRFFSTYKSKPRDGDWGDEQSWFEDLLFEEPTTASTSADWGRLAWWRKCEAALADIDQVRVKFSCPNLTERTLRNIALALKPVLSAPGRESNDGLEHAVWTMLGFAAARSRRGKLETSDGAHGRTDLQKAG